MARPSWGTYAYKYALTGRHGSALGGKGGRNCEMEALGFRGSVGSLEIIFPGEGGGRLLAPSHSHS